MPTIIEAKIGFAGIFVSKPQRESVSIIL